VGAGARDVVTAAQPPVVIERGCEECPHQDTEGTVIRQGFAERLEQGLALADACERVVIASPTASSALDDGLDAEGLVEDGHLLLRRVPPVLCALTRGIYLWCDDRVEPFCVLVHCVEQVHDHTAAQLFVNSHTIEHGVEYPLEH